MSLEGFLALGGLLRPGAKTGDVSVDQVCAHRYHHPALGERPVVQLVGQGIAAGANIEASLVGFDDPTVSKPIASAAYRVLGFPASILINQPEHTDAAIAVVSGLKKAARTAKTKPGQAKSAFESIASSLEPPSLQPSFFEEAGRSFIAAESPALAASMFEKGREVERTYNLAVDEEIRRETFLEFSFAGALTVKSLNNYATGLSDSLDADSALDAFLELVRRRTLGGLPPMTDALKTARKMAKGSSRDPKDVEAALLEDLLKAPAAKSAPAGFWKSARTALIRTAKADTSVARTLLKLQPKPPSATNLEWTDWWLELLDASGALAQLATPDKTAAAAIDPAAWISSFASNRVRTSLWAVAEAPRLLDLLQELAPTIRQNNTPVAFTGRSGWIRAELTDLALELGLTVADPSPGEALTLSGWIAVEGRDRRPLTHLAADARFASLLEKASKRSAREGRVETLGQYDQLRPGVEAALRDILDEIEGDLLHSARSAAEELRTMADSIGSFPDLAERFASLSMHGALAAQLRAGLMCEIGWPALDQTIDRLSAPATDLVAVGTRRSSWPILTLTDATLCVAIGPEAVVAEHQLRPTEIKTASRHSYFIGEDFLVTARYIGPGEAYWSSDPNHVFVPKASGASDRFRPTDELNGGYAITTKHGLSTGGPEVRSADRHLPRPPERLIGDGAHFWSVVRSGHSHQRDPLYVLVEFDPVTGTTGRSSMPRWFNDYIVDDWRIELIHSSLMPAPDALSPSLLGYLPAELTAPETTPLGPPAGLIGHRVRSRTAHHGTDWEIERIDGVSYRFNAMASSAPKPVGIIDWPGDSEPRVLMAGYDALHVFNTDGKKITSLAVRPSNEDIPNRGTPRSSYVPTAFWHHLKARDLAGSKALRSIGDVDVAPLLDAAIEAASALQPDGAIDYTSTEAAARQLGLTSEPLIRGVAGVAVYAAEVQRTLEGVQQSKDSGAADRGTVPQLTMRESSAALVGLCPGFDAARSKGSPFHQMLWLQHHFVPEDDRFLQVEAKSSNHPNPAVMIDGVGHLAVRAASPLVSTAGQEAALDLLNIWSTTIFCQEPSSFFVGDITDGEPGAGGQTSSGSWAVTKVGRQNVFLERPASGQERLLPASYNVTERHRAAPAWGTPTELQELISELRSNGPMVWDPQAPVELARRVGLDLAEAKLVWAGCPSFGAQYRFLDADQRKIMKLTAKDAEAARDGLLSRCEIHRIRAVFDRISFDAASIRQPLGEGPEDDTSLVARMAAAWIDEFGAQISVPAEALAEAIKLKLSDPAESLLVLADPCSHPALAKPAEHGVTPGRYGRVNINGGPMLQPPQIILWLNYLHWAFVHRPVGDPVHRNLADFILLVRERLTDPGRLMKLGSTRVKPDFPQAGITSIGDPCAGLELEGWISADSGDLIAACDLSQDYLDIEYVIRPARWDAIVAEHGQLPGRGPLEKMLELLANLDDYVERGASTPVPEGSYEANPLASCPGLVTEVAERLLIDAEAAALYLQLLTLMTPTDTKIKQWNAWKPVQFKKACAALLEAEFVVKAKRTRAGRTLFLPGEWTTSQAPDLPVETWKLGLHGMGLGVSSSLPGGPLTRLFERRPPHLAFALAWERFQTDPPEPL